jgi:hypothetical protein
MKIALHDAVQVEKPRVWSSHSDEELIKNVDHYYPDLRDPLLKEMLARFKHLVHVQHQSTENDVIEAETGECPNCGTKLAFEVKS